MRVEDIIEPVRQRRIEIEGEIRILEEEFKDKKEPLVEELKTCTRLLRAAEPPSSSPKTASSSRSNGSGSSSKIKADGSWRWHNASDTKAILAWVMKVPVGEEFRGVEIRDQLPLSTISENNNGSATVSSALNGFRHYGFIRFVRQYGTSKYFARVSNDVPEPLLEDLGVESLDEVTA